MRFGIVYGTRPEYIKVRGLKREYAKLIQYRQHTTLLDLESCLSDVQIDLSASSDNNRLNEIVSEVCKNSDWMNSVDGVIVQGDTTTAMAAAIAAANKRKIIFHVEAGLRTNDKSSPFPEEINRQVISRVADYHFCPTEASAENLRSEGLWRNIFVVGNTCLDDLSEYRVRNDGYILATLHRSENKDSINSWLEEISTLATKIGKKVIFVKHPSLKNVHNFDGIEIARPLDSHGFRGLLSRAELVITDSGGVQEESAFFGKKVIVCRDSTERPEGLQSGHLFLCNHPSRVGEIYNRLLKSKLPSECPYGDGRAAEKIWNIINERISSNSI